MRSLLTRSYLLITPLVLLSVLLAEELVAFQVRQHLPDPLVRTAIMMILNAVGFGLASSWIAPGLRAFLLGLRSRSRRGAGLSGVTIFLLVAYGALFYGFYRLETLGVTGLLPRLGS